MTGEPADTILMTGPLCRSLTVMARATPAIETCALLGGRGNRLTSIYPVANIAAEPATGFLMAPAGQIGAMKLMREAGESLRGIFHSHPATAAEPSDRDRAQAAYPDVYYLILSLAGEPPDLRAYYYDGADFRPVVIREH